MHKQAGQLKVKKGRNDVREYVPGMGREGRKVDAIMRVRQRKEVDALVDSYAHESPQ